MFFSWRSLISLMLFITVSGQASHRDQVENNMVYIAVDDIPLSFYPYGPLPVLDDFTHLFFDPLVRWTDKHKLELRLLEKWQVIKPGIIRFYLKKNIKFHSGNRLSSKDIVWTYLQILKDPKKKYFFKVIKNIKQVDENSFDLYTELPQTRLFDYLTHFFVLDADFYSQLKFDAKLPLDNINSATTHLPLSGTGPYKIKQYNAALQLSVVNNENYLLGDVAVKSLNFIKIKSAKSRLFALLANDVDISCSISSKTIKSVVLLETKYLSQVNSPNALFLTINPIKSAVFQSSSARNAMHLLINQEGMLKHILNGMGTVNATFTPLISIDPELVAPKLPEYDLKRAKYLLTKLDLPKELTLLVLADEVGNTPQVAKALMNMMKRAGLRLVITQVSDPALFKDSFFDYDFTLSVWQSSLMNRDNIYQTLFKNSQLTPYFNWLFDNEKALNKQAFLFEEAQQGHQIIPIFSQNKVWASDKKYNLASVFSINGIAYWHLLTTN